MIVSHQHRFVFVKTRKTAGTSIEIALAQHCGPDDIITPIDEVDEQIRRNLGHRGPQNFEVRKKVRGIIGIARRMLGKDVVRYYNHIPAGSIRDNVGAQIFDSYQKFCVVRNPWDRLIRTTRARLLRTPYRGTTGPRTPRISGGKTRLGGGSPLLSTQILAREPIFQAPNHSF